MHSIISRSDREYNYDNHIFSLGNYNKKIDTLYLYNNKSQ